MFIDSFSVQNFKSLADVTLTDLAPINVFHGLNDVGKSNILEALDLFFQLLPLALELETEWEGLTPFDLEPYSPDAIFRRQNAERQITWTVRLRLANQATPLDVCLQLERKEGKREKGEYEWELALSWPSGRPGEETQHVLCMPKAGFNLLTARRRLQIEHLEEEDNGVEQRTRRSRVGPRNLKRTLFDAYASLDRSERARFEELQRLLERHLQIGILDVGLDRSPGGSQLAGREVVARFLRSEGDITVENVGSGGQQVLLMLGQILLNPARVAAIEEPEMNLSPDWQSRLMGVLCDLISPDPGGLDQIFITSHSPQFEAAEHFYDVTYTDGETRVQKLPLPQRDRYFARLAQGEQMGPYLNSLNQVTLPQQVIDDLGLRRREPVFFYKAPDGHWRLRTKAEVLALMKDGEEYNVEPDADDGNSAG